jgi:glycosyltransferase involved in cell wall biosynthesis
MTKRVLVLQASLEPPGGGNGLTAWMIEALRTEHAVSLLTWTMPRFDVINRFFGTSLRAADVEVRLGSLPHLLDTLPLPLGLLRDFLLMRAGRAIAGEFDVVLSGMNECDLGRPSIQYVHYPRFDPVRPAVDLRWFNRPRPLRALYRTAAMRATGFSTARMRQNLTLANSDWTAARLRRLHGIAARTVYPPVAGWFADAPWARRQDAFVCIGRLSPEKRIERVVGILDRVRHGARAVTLDIVGSNDDDAYTRQIRALARRHADWVRLHEGIPRSELLAILTRSRYGIHGMPDEHFGMAVAEMVRAGCLVFVPDGGGQMEIVDAAPELVFRSDDDAVEKIAAALADPTRHDALRRRLAERAGRFSAARFVEEIRALVRDFPAAPGLCPFSASAGVEIPAP